MKRSVVFGFFLALLLSATAAQPAHALPSILPNCDQTEYYTGKDCEPGTKANCTILSSEQYFKQYETPEKRAANPPVAVKTNRACGFNDFIKLFTNLASYGLGVLAVVGLTVIVWGGFGFILAMGNQEKIQESKKTIWGGVLGTFIVLISFIMVNFFVSMLTGTGSTLFSGTSYERQFYGEKCSSYKKNCTKTGITYNATDEKLFGLSPKTGCSDDPKKKAHPVADLQTKLKQVGCYSDVIDGCFGPNSLDAVMGFQSKNDIWPRLNADGTWDNGNYGVADQDTWDKLDLVIAGVQGRGCASPLTAKVDLNESAPGTPAPNPSSVSVQPNGTVTWHNWSSTQVTIQFNEPLKTGGTKTSITVAALTDESQSFTEMGRFTYVVTNISTGKTANGTVYVSTE